MSRFKWRSRPLSIGQAKARDPELAELLAPLAEETPLTLEELAKRARPGQPLDRLAACTIILSYLRQEKA